MRSRSGNRSVPDRKRSKQRVRGIGGEDGLPNLDLIGAYSRCLMRGNYFLSKTENK